MRDTRYDLDDTIVAVSSPTSDKRVIVRIAGPDTIDKCHHIFSSPLPDDKAGVVQGTLTIDAELKIDATLYLFIAPHSYTGGDVAEIHVHTNSAVTETFLRSLLAGGLRMAQPGEFTARAYLNGKIDLAQAEAVNEIITTSNEFQLAAAEKLLAGRLARTTEQIREKLMDCLSLIEAGLDFTEQDIEFITTADAVRRLEDIKLRLEQLLSGSISYEAVIDLPAVGIAGAPNAGKSSLANKLLGTPRSIVSASHKTTRDVLTGLLKLAHCECVLFDCAGLIPKPADILDELAHQAAVDALQKSAIVVFCVDISKPNWDRDISIRGLIEPKILIPVATKSDLLTEDILAQRLGELRTLFETDFTSISVNTNAGISRLKETIDKTIIELSLTTAKANNGYEIHDTKHELALTARHKQAVAEAVDSISQAINELKAGADEIAAMMLRTAYENVGSIQQENIDEQILENIFTNFCIGK